MSVTVRVQDGATPLLQRVQRTIASGEIENAMGRGASNHIQRHLRGLNQSRPNKEGWPRQNFYAACARSVSYTHAPGQAEITISQIGFRQRLEGGEIRARNVKYLTIPAHPQAYGKRAREFSNLRFGFAENKFGNLQPALIVATPPAKQKRRKGYAPKKLGQVGETMYFLTPRVFQRADPTVLPPEADIIDAASRAVGSYLRAQGGAI